MLKKFFRFVIYGDQRCITSRWHRLWCKVDHNKYEGVADLLDRLFELDAAETGENGGEDGGDTEENG